MISLTTHQKLDSVVPNLDQPGRWDFRIVNGKAHTGSARIEEDFLTLDIALGARELAHLGLGFETPWQVLLAQDTAWQWDKYVPHPEAPGGVLRREMPLAKNHELDPSVAMALSHLSDAISKTSGVPGTHTRSAFSTEQNDSMEEALAESAWSSVRIPKEDWGFDLVTRRRFKAHNNYQYEAYFLPHPERGVKAEAIFLDQVSLGQEQCETLAEILLEMGRRLKRVRGFARPSGEGFMVGVQVFQAWPLGPTELDHLLGTLTVACNLVGPDIEELSRDSTAPRYREAFGIAHKRGPCPTGGGG